MASATIVPVEEYLRTSYKPNCEYLDGFLRPKAMGTTKHGKLQVRLCLLLQQMGLEAVVELTVQVAPTRYLIPDVAAGKQIADPYPDRPVLLCAEVLSPGDRYGSMLAKCEEYHAWGVPYCWVIDPVHETAWEYHNGFEPERKAPPESLFAGEIAIPVAALFAGL